MGGSTKCRSVNPTAASQRCMRDSRHPGQCGYWGCHGSTHWDRPEMTTSASTPIERAHRVALDSLPTNLGDVARAIQVFQATVYGEPTSNGVLLKLGEEVGELRAAVEAGDIEHAREELADVFFLVLDTARALGMTPHQLAEVAHAKLLVNIARDWRKGTDGCWSHVKGGGQ